MRLRAFSLALLSVAAASMLALSSASASSRYCGAFEADYHIRVYADHMTCRRALVIQKEYWRAPASRKVIVNGGTGAAGYTLLKRYPGWKCGSGSGGGGCVKGRAVASYRN